MNDDRLYRIIDLYDKLNDKGKQKMLEWAEVLHDSNKYKPHNNILYFQDYIYRKRAKTKVFTDNKKATLTRTATDLTE